MNNRDLETVEQLQNENRELREENNHLRKELENKDSEIEKIKEKNEELKEENQRLRQEIYGFKASKKGKKSREAGKKENSAPKKRGPPVGHKGTSRKKPERADKTIVLEFDACPHCGGELKILDEVRERYEEEIVPVPLFIIRYIILQGYCKKCDKVVYPEVPEVIGNRHFGIQFMLFVVYLRYGMNLPENKIAKILNDIYDAGVSEGTIVNYLKKAAEIFGAEYQRIKQQMREAKYCHYDDTGQRIDGENRWLWTFVSDEAALYYTSKNRGKKVVIKVLGEDYDGVTVQDFYPSYDGAPGRKQKCWAHILRDARELVEKKKPPPEALEFYEGLSQIYRDARETEKGLKTEEERGSAYAEYVKRLEKFVKGEKEGEGEEERKDEEEGAKEKWKHYEVKKLAKRALKYRHELFTFILVPGIESTNNTAERALRPCVRQRKIWGCHRTEQGARNRDIMMSVLETMKIKKKDFFVQGKEYILSKLTQKR